MTGKQFAIGDVQVLLFRQEDEVIDHKSPIPPRHKSSALQQSRICIDLRFGRCVFDLREW